MIGAVPAGGPAIMGHCAPGDSGESWTCSNITNHPHHFINHPLYSLQPRLLGKSNSRKRMGWSQIFVHIHVIISPMDYWPALTLPLSWLLDCCPAPSKATSIYLFLIWRQRHWQDKIQDVNQWQGDRDLEQEPDAWRRHHPRLHNNAVCGQTSIKTRDRADSDTVIHRTPGLVLID